MEIVTITGQTLDDFFRPKIPGGLMEPLTNKLKVLKIYGKECIGAFVFPVDKIYHFEVSVPDISACADVYISFVDIFSLILIIEVRTF